MKRILKILLIILMLIPSFIYVPKVEAKTIRDLRRELEEIRERQSQNNNNINMTESEIERDKNLIQSNNREIQQISIDIQILIKKY